MKIALSILIFLITLKNYTAATIRRDQFKPNNIFDRAELKKRLLPMQFAVTQNKETEFPITGLYEAFFEDGKYNCIVCNEHLFNSDDKLAARGYASFEKATIGVVHITDDELYGQERVEALCENCGAYLGHAYESLFIDNAYKYYANSAALSFEADPNSVREKLSVTEMDYIRAMSQLELPSENTEDEGQQGGMEPPSNN